MFLITLYLSSQEPTAPLHAPEYEHNILLVSCSSASSPIQKTTLVGGSTRMGPICSVGLCSVGSPGAIPGHVADCSNYHEVLHVYNNCYLQVTALYIHKFLAL